MDNFVNFQIEFIDVNKLPSSTDFSNEDYKKNRGFQPVDEAIDRLAQPTKKRKKNLRPNAKYECYICKKRYKELKYLRQHFTLSHLPNDGFLCEICGKKYLSRSSLYLHNKHCKNAEEKLFECKICNAIFKRKRDLKDHLEAMHLKLFQYFCLKCGHQLRWRQQICTKKITIFFCYDCSEIFQLAVEYIAHRKTAHKSEYTVECHKCKFETEKHL